MKRKVERERKLPAYSIGIAELEILLERLASLFDDRDKIYRSIDISLPKEKLDFKNVAELKQYENLKGRITKFRIWLSKDDKLISIRTSGFIYPQAIVSASGDSEAWCAGAIETTYSFLQSYKVWYHWFIYAPIGWFLFVLINIPTTVIAVLPKGTVVDKYVLIGWLATVTSLAFLYFYRERLFPSATLVISEEESFIRRHSAEFGLVIALISAILTVIGWFIGK